MIDQQPHLSPPQPPPSSETQQQLVQVTPSDDDDIHFPGCVSGCSGHGQCVHGVCVCDAGWSNEECNLQVFMPDVYRRTCVHLNDCSRHGVCDNGTCICEPDWDGSPECDEPSVCAQNCSGRGICHRGKCYCDDPWTGETCEKHSLECDTCVHGACVEGICVCTDEWYHGPHCDTLRCPAECSGHGGCNNGSCTCYRDPGTEGGWAGADCSQYMKLWCPSDCGAPLRGSCDTHHGVCVCHLNYSGSACDIQSCPQKCNFHGRCEQGKCVCVPPYQGDACETRTMASGHGGVINGVIVCDKGWAGDECDTIACPHNCNNRGACVDGVCRCRGMWRGADCSIHTIAPYDPHLCRPGFGGPGCDVVLCQPACSVHGVCNGGVCDCDPGWAGPTCAERACPSDCSGHGKCVEGICICDQGWELSDCSRSLCKNNCSGHGQCMMGTCVCDEGWGRMPLELEDCSEKQCNPECMDPYGLCDNGTCVCYSEFEKPDLNCQCPLGCNTDHAKCDKGHCTCDKGWHGKSCDVQDCPNDCSGHGDCIQGNATVNSQCECYPGWGGEDCSAHVCYRHCWGAGECEQGYCQCNAGFREFDCHVYDLPSRHGVIDLSLLGAVVCDEGWGPGTGDMAGPYPFALPLYDKCVNRTCPTTTEDGPCSGHGQCNNGTCVCDATFEGEACQNRKCPNDCLGNGVCDQDTGLCVCDPGYSTEDCAIFRLPSPAHGQIRTLSLNEDRVECDTGYTAPTCIDQLCVGNCSNHGQCLDTGKCFCFDDWIGANCSIKANVTCTPHGVLLDDGTCQCDEGYMGVNCTQSVDGSDLSNSTDTSSNGTTSRDTIKPCLHDCTDSTHGRCSNGTCVCTPPWQGEDCSVNSTSCEAANEPQCPNKCSGHGQCTRYGCKCDAGYINADCSQPMLSRGAPCPHGCHGHGLCKADNKTCWCDAGYDPSTNCEFLLCADNCTNHGVCVKGECVCNYGWAGFVCHIPLPRNNRWVSIKCEASPGRREGSSLAADLKTNELFLVGGVSKGVLLGDVWQYIPGECWTMLPDVGGKSPVPRKGHSSFFADNEFGRRVYVYGGGFTAKGEVSVQYMGDLWGFDVSKGIWYEMVSYGPSPPARSDAAVTFDAANNRMYVYGGVRFEGHENQYLSDLWMYDLSTSVNSWGGGWKKIECESDDCPTGRKGAGLAVYGTKVALFGGRDQDMKYNDVWLFESTTLGKWTSYMFNDMVLAPSPRDHMCFGWEPSNEFIYVMAGCSEAIVHDDVWRYKPPMVVWEDMNPAMDPNTPPDPDRPNTGKPIRRERVACALANSQFFIYGGIDHDLDEMHDMWMYDFTAIQPKDSHHHNKLHVSSVHHHTTAAGYI